MSPEPMPTCRELIDFLSAYLDDELDPEVRARFEEHLALCTACVDYLESYRATVRFEVAALAPDDPVPEDVPEELVRAVLGSRRR